MHQGCQCLSRQAGTARLQIKSSDELFLSQVFGTSTARQLAGKKRQLMSPPPPWPQPLFTRQVELHLFLFPICPHKMKTVWHIFLETPASTDIFLCCSFPWLGYSWYWRHHLQQQPLSGKEVDQADWNQDLEANLSTLKHRLLTPK